MITDQEWILIEKRFEHWNEKVGRTRMDGIILDKDEMLKHIKAKDEIGKELTEVQLHYLRQLKERR